MVHWIKEKLALLATPLSIFCLVASTGIAIWWSFVIPSPGYAVAILGVVAVVMALKHEMHPGEKVIWMIVVFALVFVELRAINKDREDSRQQQANIIAEARVQFKNILDSSNRNFKEILERQQESHVATMRILINSQRQQTVEFKGLLAKQEYFISRQEQLAESLSGTLIPASDSTPDNPCGPAGEGEVVILIGSNAFVTNSFPHTVLQIKDSNILSVDRTADGAIVLLLEIRGSDNRIIARINKNGFVVNRNNELQIQRPDKSTIIVEDEYGDVVLNARFLNSKAISITGIVNYRGRKIPVDLPYIKRACFKNNKTDIRLD